MLFEDSQSTFESLSLKRKQSDANSYGIWLVAGMSSYLINLPEISDRHNTFDVAYNLLERNPIIKKLKACPHSFLIKIRRKKLPSDFLIHVLKNNLKMSD